MFLHSIDSMVYESSIISSCHATSGNGGGVYFYLVDNRVRMTSIRLHSCSAGYNGGGVSAYGLELDLTSVDLSQCEATYGGDDVFLELSTSITCTATCTPGTFPPMGSHSAQTSTRRR